MAKLSKQMVDHVDETQEELAKRIKDTIYAARRNSGRNLSAKEQMEIACDCRKQEFLRHFFASNGNISYCCVVTGIARSTFLKWKREDVTFNDAVTEVKEAMLDVAEQQLLKNIQAGKETSLIFFLCNKGKERGYQDIRKIENKVQVPIQINVEYADNDRQVKKITAKTTGKIESKSKKLRLPAKDPKKN